MLGFEEEVRKIKHLLLGEPSSRQIISIVGMGGIGKTTLARTIYRDSAVSRHFDVQTWITVSQNYDARAVLLSLLNAGKEEKQTLSNRDLATDVHKSLKSRRYIIILDDIWDTDVFDDVKNRLPDDCNGSRIVITTRHTDIAAGSEICNVPRMDKDTSWNLLEKKIFPHGDSCPPELVDIGISIAGKCLGLPLTIVVIAGLLQVSHTRAWWENIANDVKEAMQKNDEHHVLDILSVSYTNLPDGLRPCLLYLVRFPQDQQISASNLIKIWVAEGILERRRGCKNLEESGYECLEDLIKRNLISASRKTRNGLPNKCFIHDLIREMCIILSQGTFNPRDIIFFPIFEALHFTDQQQSQRLEKGYELLRVLDATLEETKLDCPVFQVCELVNLRYLSLRCSVDSFKIPTNICMFTNLETLIIYLTNVFDVRLPPEIWEIPKLRHLLIFGEGILDYVDGESVASFLPLESLETLLHIRIEDSSVRILERIPNIRKLGFKYFQGSMHFVEHLLRLHHLEVLHLVAAPREDYAWQQNRIFPDSLRKLKMEDVKMPWEYVGWILGSLPNLEMLTLKDGACQGREWETKEGDFLKLKMLEIEDWNLEIWRMESSTHLPVLEQLKFSYCHKLKELPSCLGEIETLELIQVSNSHKNVDEWAEEIFKQQQDIGNELFQIRLVPALGKETQEGKLTEEEDTNMVKKVRRLFVEPNYSRLAAATGIMSTISRQLVSGESSFGLTPVRRMSPSNPTSVSQLSPTVGYLFAAAANAAAANAAAANAAAANAAIAAAARYDKQSDGHVAGPSSTSPESIN